MTCTDNCRRPTGGQSHCGADGCHKTFSGVTWFDLHRIGGHCKDIEGLVEKDGMWATPERHAQYEGWGERFRQLKAAKQDSLRGQVIDDVVTDGIL